MAQYIDKAAIVAEIKERIDRDNERAAFYSSNSEHDYFYRVKEKVYKSLLSFLDTIEVKDMSMPALDNGNMPVERWKEACEAASCQANYRKSKGLTETCDDYFVDGVQWADEHPKKVKEVDLEKELYKAFGQVKDFTLGMRIARHFFELGLKVNQDVDLELIVSWFDHITQIADDRKTANGVVMVDWAALDEIKCLAKESSEFIKTHYKAQKGE